MKYVVTIEVYATTRVEVEADSADQAETKAFKNAHVSVCHQCSHKLDIGDLGDVLEVEELEDE